MFLKLTTEDRVWEVVNESCINNMKGSQKKEGWFVAGEHQEGSWKWSSPSREKGKQAGFGQGEECWEIGWDSRPKRRHTISKLRV